MKTNKETAKEYVAIIIDSIDAIFNYLDGKTEAEFISNAQLHDACLMRLIVIGEYAAKIPEEVQQRNPEIAWREIKAARNFYVHVYLSVGWERIWETIHSKLPQLRMELKEMRLNDL